MLKTEREKDMYTFIFSLKKIEETLSQYRNVTNI